MSTTPIAPDEILYRRVPSGRGCYKLLPNGGFGIEPTAFEDRGCRISVDRAVLCANDPWHTLNQQVDGEEDDREDGGVASLVTVDVRAVKNISRMGREEKVILEFKIEVEHMPIPKNDAHAEIYGIPEFTDIDKKRAFRRLRHALAELSEKRGWEIVTRKL